MPHQQTFTTRWRGQNLTLAQLAQVSGLDLTLIEQRYKTGKRGEDLTAPARAQTPRKAPQIEIRSRGLL